MRDHELTISSGKKQIKSFDGNSFDYNVNLQILTGIALGMSQSTGILETFEPKLTIYTDNVATLSKNLKLPGNIILHSDIKDFPLQGKSTKAFRKSWYGRVQFENSTPADNIEGEITTIITLWEKAVEGGIKITRVDNKGFFSAAFSDKEIDDLKAGNSWLTITTGNWLTEAKQTDTKFPIEFLSKEDENLKPVIISSPKFYYGRILFEDGSPPFITPEPWPGAEIMIDFPYAGSPQIDSQGYFKVFFTKEQFEKAKADKVRKNIYIPDYEETGISTARFAFPISDLSQDKSKAGVVKIPRPKLPRQELSMVESKIGKQIPGFENIKIPDFQPELVENKSVLICFWDMEQRPSRQCILDLEKQKELLQNKNIAVFIIHAGKDSEDVTNLLKENNISIATGTIDGDPYDTLLAWGARGLPWLVLTDKQHTIIAAGFNPDELNGKIKENENAKD
jgi:hypothetical protein